MQLFSFLIQDQRKTNGIEESQSKKEKKKKLPKQFVQFLYFLHYPPLEVFLMQLVMLISYNNIFDRI
jgi:hypothetical protein